ncbi:hypothetical protein OSG_eHP25_00020 [environmental Halophage eHP-25]|nr:hypothetical protein OSG_eHP25_00020 [environmental Halophage eHP-25]
MAAPTSPISGVTVITEINSTVVAAQTDATLSWPTEVREITTKNDYGWQASLPGMEEWTLEHSGLVINNSGDEFISNSNAKFEIEADFGSGLAWHTIQYLDSIEATLETGIAETGGLDKSLARYIRPAQRSMSFDIEGSYLDPAASVGEEYNELFANRKSSDDVNVRLTFADKTFTGNANVGDVEFSFQGDSEDATVSVSFQSDGQITESGTDFGSGFELFMDAFFNQNSVNVALKHYNLDTFSAVTGSTTWTGSGYISTINLSAAHGEEATADVTVEGDGPLTQGTA